MFFNLIHPVFLPGAKMIISNKKALCKLFFINFSNFLFYIILIPRINMTASRYRKSTYLYKTHHSVVDFDTNTHHDVFLPIIIIVETASPAVFVKITHM